MSYVYDREELNNLLAEEGIAPIPEDLEDDIYSVEMVDIDSVIEWEGVFYGQSEV